MHYLLNLNAIQTPITAPSDPIISDANEKIPAPQNVGILLPKNEPRIIPTQITDFELII